MIDYTLGIPGSGKTYRAMYMLWYTFKPDEKQKKFFDNDRFYTNINEFKFELFGGLGKKFDFDLFYSHISLLYIDAQNGATDSELILKSKEFELDNALFVIDECHNFLDKDDKILVWWLTYHRHLHQNILLITQNLSLVKSKYKVLTENFFMAVPSSRRFNFSAIFGTPKLQYKHYATSKMQKSDYAGTIDLPFYDEIYNAYHSGANTQSKNLVKKYLIFALLGLLFLVFIFILVRSYWAKKYEKTDDNTTVSSAPVAPAGGVIPLSSNSSTPPTDKKIVFCDLEQCSDPSITPHDFYRYRIVSSIPVASLPTVQQYVLEVQK